MLSLKIAGCVANNVDPDETPRFAASHLGLHCLLRPVCSITYGMVLPMMPRETVVFVTVHGFFI